jgi:hypothetical protein
MDILELSVSHIPSLNKSFMHIEARVQVGWSVTF